MSTRANIFICEDYYDSDKEILYHHCDGYPEGVGRDLVSLLMRLSQEVGDKPLTRKEVAEYICKHDDQFHITTPCMAADAEYIYEINLKRRRVDWEHLYTHREDLLCFF